MPGIRLALVAFQPLSYRRKAGLPRASLQLTLGILLVLRASLLSSAADRASAALPIADAFSETSERPHRTRELAQAVDNRSGDDGRVCTETCFSGLMPRSTVTCEAYNYNPKLMFSLTDEKTRRASQSSFGDRTRLRSALKRFYDGGNLTVVTIGGSITAGQGAVDAPPYPKWLQQVLHFSLPDQDRVRVHNGAVPGTSSQYMSSCYNVHVPKEADIIVVEYAVNDEEMPMPHMNNQVWVAQGGLRTSGSGGEGPLNTAWQRPGGLCASGMQDFLGRTGP